MVVNKVDLGLGVEKELKECKLSNQTTPFQVNQIVSSKCRQKIIEELQNADEKKKRKYQALEKSKSPQQ